MSNSVAWVNEALALLKRPPITSFLDLTDEGQAARQLFDGAVRTVVNGYPWACISRHVSLAPAADVAADIDTETPYHLPADAAHIWSAGLPGQVTGVPFRREGNVLWALARDGVVVLYRSSDRGETDYSPWMVDALVAELLWRFGARMGKPADEVQLYRRAAAETLSTARRQDAQQGGMGGIRRFPLIDVR